MYDGGKILAGLLVFVILASFPLWYNAVAKGPGTPPELKLVTDSKECVADKNYMRIAHMNLLNQWRDEVVRQGKRWYVSSNGKQYEMNLSGTCMNCHSNKSEFCDRCHTYASVAPYCWDCHVEPVEPGSLADAH